MKTKSPKAKGATGETYVNNWLHVGFVNVDGEKMSKSLGNFFTIRDVMQQFAPEVIRYFIVGSHYRSPLNFSDSALKDARSTLSRFYQSIKIVGELEALFPPFQLISTQISATAATREFIEQTLHRFDSAMNDDFNTPEALAVLFEINREINRTMRLDATPERAQAILLTIHLRKLGGILGLLQSEPLEFLQGEADAGQGLTAEQIEAQIAARHAAKAARNFSEADLIRKTLLEAGIVLEDSKEGTTWRRSE